ncbi:hypothetical protein CKO28_24520 [Rhodovibrio sodomensis]|uniref:Uncharacterized protein n=1 Tax=Rhodovibrio sodomensis TaxID=1088 RepID=A0ABS1DLQ9_9PROT|nr:hypothetical protein [Rhodovibrio sodomensis]MBK1671174.1 hypothetical protein [Rhodovibrio sodomensis]
MTEATRRLQLRLLETLPEIAERVIQGYQDHTDTPPPEAAGDKEFSARQSAGKAALSHLDALIKLLRWAEAGVSAELDAAPGDGGQPGDAAETDRLNRLLREARAALGRIEAVR